METVVVWLLITVGGTHTQPAVLEKFASKVDCEEVRKELPTQLGVFPSEKLAVCTKARILK